MSSLTREQAAALGVPAEVLAAAYPGVATRGVATATPKVAPARPAPMLARRSWTFVVEGRPQPKARPRVTENGTYTPTKTVRWERAVYDAALEVGIDAGSGPVRVDVRIYYADRGGADPVNVMCAVMDGLVGRKRGKGLTRKPIADDRWTVVRQGGWMCMLDKDRPRVEVEVRLLEAA